jgi:hypothetical protein
LYCYPALVVLLPRAGCTATPCWLYCYPVLVVLLPRTGCTATPPHLYHTALARCCYCRCCCSCFQIWHAGFVFATLFLLPHPTNTIQPSLAHTCPSSQAPLLLLLPDSCPNSLLERAINPHKPPYGLRPRPVMGQPQEPSTLPASAHIGEPPSFAAAATAGPAAACSCTPQQQGFVSGSTAPVTILSLSSSPQQQQQPQSAQQQQHECCLISMHMMRAVLQVVPLTAALWLV